MNDDDGLIFQIPEPGRWVSYEWVVSTTRHHSVSCCESTGRFSIKNVGTSDGGRCWCETEFVHDGSTSSENLLFKLLVDPKKPSDVRMSRTGWFRLNDEPAQPFKTFSPNLYPDLAYLMEQVCGHGLFSLRGTIEQHESLGVKAVSYSRGQLECLGTSTIAVKEGSIGSERKFREKTDRTIWRNAAIPFLALVESQVIVNQRFWSASGNPRESAWTSALQLSDFGGGATSRLTL